MERRFVPVEGCKLSFLEAGSGNPLVFVHGSVTTSDLFRETVQHFSARYLAIAVDLPGYGQSEKPGRGYAIDQFATDLLVLFDTLKLDRVVLLGVSMGGFVAQRFALDHPERLAGLVLASTSDGELAPGVLEGDPREAIRRMGWEKFSAGLITGAFPPWTDKKLIDSLCGRISTWNEQVISDVMVSVRRFNTRGDLSRIAVPTLIMVGSEDHQQPVPLSRRMHEMIKGSRLAVFEGAGHFMMIEQPDRFRAVLEDFLREIKY